MSLADKKGGVFEVHGSSPCPCGGSFKAGYADGDEKTGTPMLMHSDPACETFVKLDLLEYLAWARAHRNGRPV